MKRIAALLITAGVLLAGTALAQIEIVYWQYQFDARVEAMDQLIADFEAENPGITVRMETFPYDAYPQQVAASLPAGTGADVVQLFYGWLPTWERSGYVIPLPAEHFDFAALDSEFVPLAQGSKLDGAWYGLPTAVRSLALFYNMDHLAEAGYDAPPATWDEFIEIAAALKVARGPRVERYGWGPGGQDHHIIREVLTRQFGTQPYSDDLTEVLYDNDAGMAAFEFFTSMITEDEIGEFEFVPGGSGYREGFRNLENISMIFDGSFAIASTRNDAQFNWGVAELPTLDNGVKANFGSYWMNALTPNAAADPARLEASAKFLEFVTRPEAMQLWLDTVGELPARQDLIADPELASDPILGPFISSLAYATATPFLDESAQRNVIVDAYNRVLLDSADVAASWTQAASEDQAILDSFNE